MKLGRIQMSMLAFGLLLSPLFATAGEPKLIGENLTSNRFDRLPPERLQVSIFYDGTANGRQVLELAYLDMQTNRQGFIAIDGIANFKDKVTTREYDLNGSKLLEFAIVKNVIPNGAIDGMAFGLYWKDSAGKYHVYQSSDEKPLSDSTFVGAWPIAFDVADLVPQVTDSNAKAQVRMSLSGAKYLGNGLHRMRLR
jgi:hypothetical protein